MNTPQWWSEDPHEWWQEIITPQDFLKQYGAVKFATHSAIILLATVWWLYYIMQSLQSECQDRPFSKTEGCKWYNGRAWYAWWKAINAGLNTMAELYR